MNAEDKADKIERLVDSWTDAMDLDDLVQFFKEKQVEYLESLTDEEFQQFVNDNADLLKIEDEEAK